MCFACAASCVFGQQKKGMQSKCTSSVTGNVTDVLQDLTNTTLAGLAFNQWNKSLNLK